MDKIKLHFFKSGFNVAIRGTNLYDITDENGYFEINGVPSGTHTLVITRLITLMKQLLYCNRI